MRPWQGTQRGPSRETPPGQGLIGAQVAGNTRKWPAMVPMVPGRSATVLQAEATQGALRLRAIPRVGVAVTPVAAAVEAVAAMPAVVEAGAVVAGADRTTKLSQVSKKGLLRCAERPFLFPGCLQDGLEAIRGQAALETRFLPTRTTTQMDGACRLCQREARVSIDKASARARGSIAE